MTPDELTGVTTSAFAFSSQAAPDAEATPPPRRLDDKC